MIDKSGIKLKKIFNNTTSGSNEVLFLLNDYFRHDVDDPVSFKETYLLAKKWFTDFASIQSYLTDIKPFLDSDNLEGLKSFAGSFKKNYSRKYINIFKNALPYLDKAKTIITLSNSSTLFEVFRMLGENNNFKLYILESRPKFEGRLLAKKLLKYNIKIEFITDAMLAYYFPKIDAVVIGADKILKNGDVVNKVGSKLLAITAKYYNVPFYVVSDKSKFTNETEYAPQTYPAEEIWKYKHPNLTITNVYFEVVENELITKVITD